MKLHLALALICVLCCGHSAHAVVTVSTETVIEAGGVTGDPYTPVFPSGGASMVDVINGMLPLTSSGNFATSGSGGLTVLTDGSIDNFWGNGSENGFHSSYASVGGAGRGTSATYALGGSYALEEIVIFGGWTDSGRDEQKVDVLYSTDGTTFTSLGATLGGNEAGGDPINHRNSITDTTGTLASGVVAVRFDFATDVENAWVGQTEIDVFGTQLNVPGDATGEGTVNINDFFLISDNFLTVPSAVGQDGDVNYDNFVDQKDFQEWRVASGAGVSALATIPEPASILFAGIGTALSLCTMRRRS